MKKIFVRNWQHFAVLGGFLVLMFLYFSPEFSGYNLKQHDVEQYMGMAQETKSYREISGEEPLWTNSMFGGMPTIQISTLYDGNIFQQSMIWFLGTVGVPSGIFLLHLIGFYILAICLRVKPIIGFIGALAFAFASYEIIILQAGHNSKAMTIALMAPVLGAFILAYRRNWKLGVALSGLFMTYEIASNHLQVSYYLGILLVGLGIYELFSAIRSKTLKHFSITTLGLIVSYGLALFINYGNISLTNDYAKHTIRGGNEVTINSDGTEANVITSGLDKNYITNWSYGVGESVTLISPYVKGSASVGFGDSNFKPLVEQSDLSSDEINKVLNAPFGVYWGEQPMTSGPVYIGVVMFFLMLMGMFYIKDKSKWVYLGVSILALTLSWGKNFMGLTEFFIDYIPGYNKFRTVTIILILVELCIPIIAVLLLDKLYREREAIKETKKKFLKIAVGFLAFLLLLKVVGLGDNYSSQQELARNNELSASIENQVRSMDPQMLAQNYQIDINNQDQLKQFVDYQVGIANEQFDLVKKVRKDIYQSSMNRSIIFATLIIGILLLYFYTAVSTPIIFGGIAVLILLDFIPVDKNYLNAESDAQGNYKHWSSSAEAHYPLSPEMADYKILELESLNPKVQEAIVKGEKRGLQKAEDLGYSGGDKRRVIDSYRFSALNFATNYRVFDFNGGWNSSRASYFHKSLGGYHGAKLRNIQNLFDFHLARSNNKVYDMMNVKYFIQGEDLRPNATALGPVWFIETVESFSSPNEEIQALGTSFKLINTGNGELLVNRESVKEAIVFGAEKIQYVIVGQDTLVVPLSNGLKEGMEANWVVDVNGATNLVPANMLKMDSLNSFRSLVQMKVLNEFDPSTEAIMLESEANKLKSKSFTTKGSLEMVAYTPNKIEYIASCEGDQFAVFSEIYYPNGWKAFVDGEEVNVIKTNYLLRGLELKTGKHKIEFIFNLPKYEQSNNFARFGSVLLFMLVSFGIFSWYKESKAV
jgi:hypothetical protein